MGTTRSAVLKVLIASIASTAAILLLFDIAAIAAGSGGCDSSVPAPLAGAMELDSAFRELISLGWLGEGDHAVFVGPDAIAAAVIAQRMGLPGAIATPTTACCALPFDADSFDFAFSAALDRARVPARVVLEMERVLRPGQVGAIFRLRRASGLGRPEELMKAAAPVASLLRFSDVIGARAMNGSAMVAFRKHRNSGGESGSSTPWNGADTPCKERMTITPGIIIDVIELVRAAIVVVTGRFGTGVDLFGT
ncbi:hypothetical protein KFK09_002745 [Dendrobium nobile]|uniref:Methyltransferase type 11 domain-containing protein n=1 Tax=Dendrobium nobile TaxID=94219 RepID=A0A8T3C279_DENNO|nr:hypothetical protein KFK09_002745 [Dendrobium nobile]